MKLNEIVIGGTYWTRVSGAKVQVVVSEVTTKYNGRKVLVVTRLDNGRVLQKDRSAAALHLTRDFMEEWGEKNPLPQD